MNLYYVDDRNFVYVYDENGLPFRLPCRLVNRSLEFFDKDRIRSVARGSRTVSVSLDLFASLGDTQPKSEILKG